MQGLAENTMMVIPKKLIFEPMPCSRILRSWEIVQDTCINLTFLLKLKQACLRLDQY